MIDVCVSFNVAALLVFLNGNKKLRDFCDISEGYLLNCDHGKLGAI